MLRSEERLVSAPRPAKAAPPAPPSRSERDPRIDAFRGIALVMILIDHMPGNPYEAGTIRNFGFSDAAEAFFVMSGIAAGLAYSGGFDRWRRGEGSLWRAVSPLWLRAWTLYLVQIFLTVFALAAFAWAAGTFWRAEFLEIHNTGLIYSNPREALPGLLMLSYQLGYVNILPAYIVLLLGAPLALWAGTRWPWPVIGASFALWFCASLWRWNLPNWPGGGGWFFSPMAWQCIFVIGLMIGIRQRQGRPLLRASPVLLGLAVAFLVFTLLWRVVPGLGEAMNHLMWQLGELGVPPNMVTHTKTYLGFPRLLHILALVYVLSCLPVVRRAAATRLAAPLRLLGRQGLLVFAAGTALALLGQIVMRVEPGEAWPAWALPPLALAISFALAWVKDLGRPKHAPPRATRGYSAAPPP
ncbi:OpgC family protein [Pseudoroseicyclus tamaricis]|uniref:OpgC domain-containing protein n=1 Tax=Pseudoroseicyclus tamaricis TaxID=2705421 RepID=A0A6B2JSK7_9RHOB|nr:OpgC domain-containing protein [Pseudoroseicyclus tamaricis]NDV01208.1 OpgC domain-containing protein [Pseudoroseicyclus tamaricis]